jgi:hypothetical protein
MTLTDPLISANTVVQTQLEGAKDSTCTALFVTKTGGSATVTCNSTATGNVNFNWKLTGF